MNAPDAPHDNDTAMLARDAELAAAAVMAEMEQTTARKAPQSVVTPHHWTGEAWDHQRRRRKMARSSRQKNR